MSEFMRALFAEDELGAVIRAHILIEVQVESYAARKSQLFVLRDLR